MACWFKHSPYWRQYPLIIETYGTVRLCRICLSGWLGCFAWECAPSTRSDSTGSNLCFPLFSVFLYTVCTRCSSMCPSLGTHYVSAFVPSPPQLPVVEEAWPGLRRLSDHWPRPGPSPTPARVFRVTGAKDGAWPHPNLLFVQSLSRNFEIQTRSCCVRAGAWLEGEMTSRPMCCLGGGRGTGGTGM